MSSTARVPQLTDSFDVEEVLAKMKMQEKIKLLSGKDMSYTEAIPEHGIPSMRITDGPNGIRGTRFFNGALSTCFPCATGLASSFDIELARKVGEALGIEARVKNCHIILAPTVNIQRSPIGGRGFEFFSEDPHLNGTIASAYIKGVQSKGVATTIKHYVANEQEYQKFSMSSDVSERALREIYLKPFQIAIKDSNPWALMAAYNRVNGVHVSEDKRILTDILRKEWGYEGMTMSDWIGVYSITEPIKAGLDMEMPGPSVVRGKAVQRALTGGKLFPEDIDNCVRRILGLLKYALASGIEFNGPENDSDPSQFRPLLRKAAADATVLLKNDEKILPLSIDQSSLPKKIAVIGPNAKRAYTSGGGSAVLLSTYTVSPLKGIEDAAVAFEADVQYRIGVTSASFNYLPLMDDLIEFDGLTDHLKKLDLPDEIKGIVNDLMEFDGKPGALIEFWNESPLDDFMRTKADLEAERPVPVWLTHTRSTNCFLADGIDEKVNGECWLRYSTKFIPDETGDWEFSLTIIGFGNLFVNGQLVVDQSTDPEEGDLFFGVSTKEVRGVIHGLEANKKYDMEIRTTTSQLDPRGSPFTSRGGIRVGAMRQVKEEDAIKDAVDLAKKSDVTILVIGLNIDWESEGFDREHMDLPKATDNLVNAVFDDAEVRNVIVVNQSGTPVTMPWVHKAHTLLQAFYGGDELGNGIADVIFGKVNPSGKLALTFPKKLEDNPSHPSFGAKGQVDGRVLYKEDIYVGYRNYGKNLEPLFAFGHGLSYTTFEYSDLYATPPSFKDTFNVSFTIKNTGNFAGSEVAQVYIADPVSSLPRPAKELKGFTKVYLEKDESKTVNIELGRDAISFYDDRKKTWIAEEGIFEVQVAASSRLEDIKLRKNVSLGKTFTWNGL